MSYALRTSWLVMVTLFSILSFTAIGWHLYLLASLLIGFITWESLDTPKARYWLIVGSLVNFFGGLICKTFFFLGPGIAPKGFLVVLPVAAISIGIALKIFYLEENPKE